MGVTWSARSSILAVPAIGNVPSHSRSQRSVCSKAGFVVALACRIRAAAVTWSARTSILEVPAIGHALHEQLRLLVVEARSITTTFDVPVLRRGEAATHVQCSPQRLTV